MLVQILDNLVEAGVDVLWASQEPTDASKLFGDWMVVTNDKIDAYNNLFHKVKFPGFQVYRLFLYIQAEFDHLTSLVPFQVLRYSKVKIWSSAKLVAAQNLDESIDGYHLGWKTLIQDAQVHIVNTFSD